ncbi:MAG: endopeptidase La, partial [Oscillospiraceae bacterium]
ESAADEIQNYYDKISKLGASDEVVQKLNSEVNRLSQMQMSSQEAVVIRNYLDTCLALPWNVYTKDVTDIKKAAKVLDKDHYGLKKVKERILETFAVRCLNKDVKGQILCLVGPPGTGKTSVGKSIAKALGRKYVRVSLGGVRDESDIRGHRKTYVGAMEGRIMNAMKQVGSKNPVILLDEIDKMGNDYRGDPSSAMLEVLDSEQNTAFRDHFIELPFDLSDVLFITTANTTETIQPPLLDRMEVIELASYTREEKFNIAKNHLIPKQIKKNGLKAAQMRITDKGIYTLIDSYTREAGVRNLERTIGTLCRKAAKEIVENDTKRVIFKDTNIEKYLGHKKYLRDISQKVDAVGEVNGLAWTSVGGVILPLEVLVLDGKGKIELTGSLGDVMKESAKIAVSYCRSVAEKYGIEPDFYEKKDIHIHAPEGAVPKDGPSAGVTMVTALISALSGIAVRADVAMTGEITLNGKVLPIGGLREKTMAAYKEGIKTVIVPKDNIGDLDEVDDEVKLNVEFVFAETLQDVLDTALVQPKNSLTESDVPLELLNSSKSGKSERVKTTV